MHSVGLYAARMVKMLFFWLESAALQRACIFWPTLSLPVFNFVCIMSFSRGNIFYQEFKLCSKQRRNNGAVGRIPETEVSRRFL